MMISTRGRYALRVMVDLAEHDRGDYIPLKDIAERQDISRKYLENIMAELSKAGFVAGVHGKGGGYRLKRAPSECAVSEILTLMEGTLAPVACLECGAKPCPRAARCRTLPLWTKLNELIEGYLSGVTLADLMREGDEGDYVI